MPEFPFSPPFGSTERLLVIQRHVLDVLVRLMVLNQRLYEIRQQLPLPASYLGMEDGTVDFSAVGLLYAKLTQVQGQRFEPAIEALRSLIQVSDEELLVSKDDPFSAH